MMMTGNSTTILPILVVDGIRKQFRNTPAPAVDNLSLQLDPGQILTLLGPSGCGKTTLLRLIAGFEKPDQGLINLNQRVVAQPRQFVPPEKRGVGMVFQDYALFPHLTVADNIGFGLQATNQSKRAITQRVGEVLRLVNLEQLARRYPYQLSGGQQQRIALARALAPRPDLVLLDEPLSNLDVQVRSHLRHELRKILKAAGTSAIFVTHDQEEALAISDIVGVMYRGQLEQIDRPEMIYHQPQSRFVAEFVTQANFLRAERQGEQWLTELGGFRLVQALSGNQADVMIRPEAMVLSPDPAGQGRIVDSQFLGREQNYTVELPSGQQLQVRAMNRAVLPVDARVDVKVTDAQLCGFERDHASADLSVR